MNSFLIYCLVVVFPGVLCSLLVPIYILHKPLDKGKGINSREDAVKYLLQTVPVSNTYRIP